MDDGCIACEVSMEPAYGIEVWTLPVLSSREVGSNAGYPF